MHPFLNYRAGESYRTLSMRAGGSTITYKLWGDVWTKREKVPDKEGVVDIRLSYAIRPTS